MVESRRSDSRQPAPRLHSVSGSYKARSKVQTLGSFTMKEGPCAEAQSPSKVAKKLAFLLAALPTATHNPVPKTFGRGGADRFGLLHVFSPCHTQSPGEPVTKGSLDSAVMVYKMLIILSRFWPCLAVDKMEELIPRHWTGNEEALRLVAAHGFEQFECFERLDTFGHNAVAQ